MDETVYFDTCAINRLNDSSTEPRVQRETKAVVRLLDEVAANRLHWTASEVLRMELERNSDPIRRVDALAILRFAQAIAPPRPATRLRANQLAAAGFKGLDSLHLAMAEQEKADWLITTDDRFLKLATRLAISTPEVINPVDLVQRRFPWLLPKP